MFVFDGKISLRKIFAQYRHSVRWRLLGIFVDTTNTFRRFSDVNTAVNEVTCRLCWRYLEYYPEAFVLNPAGHLIRLDDWVWIPPLEVYQPSNGLFDLRSGLLKASDDHLQYYSSATCAEMLAPFEGCPVFLSEDADKLFEDEFLWEGSFSAIPSKYSALVESELDIWFDVRATELGVLRPPAVEVQYIDGDKESLDVMDTEDFRLPDDPSVGHLTSQSEQAMRNNLKTVSDCVL